MRRVLGSLLVVLAGLPVASANGLDSPRVSISPSADARAGHAARVGERHLLRRSIGNGENHDYDHLVGEAMRAGARDAGRDRSRGWSEERRPSGDRADEPSPAPDVPGVAPDVPDDWSFPDIEG